MVAQVPLFSGSIPNSLDQAQDELEDNINGFLGHLPAFGQGVNNVAVEINDLALRAEVAAESTGVAKWSALTNYAEGAVVYSPTDFYNYRRKTAGSGGADPSSNTTNWVLLTKTAATNAGGELAPLNVSFALTTTSFRLQVVAMASSGQSVTLPAATSINKGPGVFWIRNSGLQRFGVFKNGGGFVCLLDPGQTIALGLYDNSTAAGLWTVSGEHIPMTRTDEISGTEDANFIQLAWLTATKAIAVYKNQTSGFLEAVVLNSNATSGTPVAISTEAIHICSVAATTATQAVVVYQLATSTADSWVYGYVLTINATTHVITKGDKSLALAGSTNVNAIATNGVGCSVSLITGSTTKLLLTAASVANNAIQVGILLVSGTTLSVLNRVDGDSVSCTGLAATQNSVSIISSTKAIVAYINSSLACQVRMQTIDTAANTVIPSGSAALTLTPPGTGISNQNSPALLALDTDRAILVRAVDKAYGSLIVYLLNISGTTPSLIRSKIIDVGGYTTFPNLTRLDANHAYLTFQGGENNGTEALVLRIAEDDRIFSGPAVEISSYSYGAYGGLSALALDSKTVMTAYRNSSTFFASRTVYLNY